ncbi:13E12 repeat family protein [Pseudarthrobacter sp. NS4]|uniref:13E12 repeat family protein n=1 Tax=Pseudarthrobacter sp. NS4 TaxID=2973976 RepID=UPI002163421E|nr:13E12 repeat family protein [Pseudarthrobacter sp. NS4]
MEAIGDQLVEFGGSAAALPRALRGDRIHGAYDAGARLRQSSRLHAVPANVTARESEPCGGAAAAAEPATSPAVAVPPPVAGTAAAERSTAIGARGERPDLAAFGNQLAAAAVAAGDGLASADYVQAADFAGQVETLSRTVEYLQLIAASTVDRTRTQAITAAAAARAGQGRTGRPGSTGRGWVTGWDANGVETLNETDANWPAPTAQPTRAELGSPVTSPVVTSPADDGCRNTAEFLRLRLRIPIREARRRLALAHQALPGTTLAGEPTPPAHEHLAAALTPTNTRTGNPAETSTEPDLPAGPVVSSHAATIITATLDRLKHHTSTETLDRIEHHLTTTAAAADPDFLTRLAQRWTDTIDADGTEPTEEALRHTQGAFIRKPRHGLHHLEIFATTDQYEHLLTVMNTATNPRTTTPNTSASTTSNGTNPDPDRDVGQERNLERRTRPQQQLDGLVSAVKAALTTNNLPTTGGNRPQIIATINYQDLFPHLPDSGNDNDNGAGAGAGPRTNTDTDTGTGTRTPTGTGTGAGTGAFVFTGPVAASTLRKIACDADIIPALLGTHGEILGLTSVGGHLK